MSVQKVNQADIIAMPPEYMGDGECYIVGENDGLSSVSGFEHEEEQPQGAAITNSIPNEEENQSFAQQSQAAASDDRRKRQIMVNRLRKERRFHLREMENDLDVAMRYAQEGNKRFMKLRLERAKTHSMQNGQQTCDYALHRIKGIRQQLQFVSLFRSHETETELKVAQRYAIEGNKAFMKSRLKNAKNLSSKADILPKYRQHESTIYLQLNDERQFHFREMEVHLGIALKYAKEGNKAFMSIRLDKAKSHAVKGGALFDFFPLERKVHGQFRGAKGFHYQKMETDLQAAIQYAQEGNEVFMNIRLEQAEKHAHCANCLNFFDQRISEVLSIFNDIQPQSKVRESRISSSSDCSRGNSFDQGTLDSQLTKQQNQQIEALFRIAEA